MLNDYPEHDLCSISVYFQGILCNGDTADTDRAIDESVVIVQPQLSYEVMTRRTYSDLQYVPASDGGAETRALILKQVESCGASTWLNRVGCELVWDSAKDHISIGVARLESAIESLRSCSVIHLGSVYDGSMIVIHIITIVTSI